MRILRPLFLGLACGEAFRFPEGGRLALFRCGFLPSGGGAFFGLGGGGAFFVLGGGGAFFGLGGGVAFFGLGGGGVFLALGGGGGLFFPFGGGGGGLSAMLTPHANTGSL